MVDAAGNRTLSETYGMLKPVISRLMLAGKSQRQVRDGVTAEHADIIQALRNREGRRVAAIGRHDPLNSARNPHFAMIEAVHRDVGRSRRPTPGRWCGPQ